MNVVDKMLASWANVEGNVYSIDELLAWIQKLNQTTHVKIEERSIDDNSFWFYDDYKGEVLNSKRSFFSIKGIRRFENGVFIREQPIIFQPEIGYLGIICREIDGVLNFLMQAKIEPGNINCVQISPTIQATKSNFTRVHGGKLPSYFEYFENAAKYHVVFDQIQSEQATRFYKKRNRNIIMIIDEEIDVCQNFRWMTLGQIKKLMETDNLVNMDTRTVLSGIPLLTSKLPAQKQEKIKKLFRDETLYRSIFETNVSDSLSAVYQQLNDYKMFQETTTTPVPLSQLVDWTVDPYGIVCKKSADFSVRYFDIEISGREVHRWMQPLFKAIGMATFGLITKKNKGIRKFLVKTTPEIGSFDKAEVGPTVQWEPTHSPDNNDVVEQVFSRYLKKRQGLLYNTILSEEGGRFYHEQNHNIIIEIDDGELNEPGHGYVWVDYSALNFLVQVNNCLNIQLRNLLSLLQL